MWNDDNRWHIEIVEALLPLRRRGVPFESAWRYACTQVGRRRPQWGRKEDDPDALPFHEFFRRACKREWHGEVTLDYQALGVLADPPDEGWRHCARPVGSLEAAA